LELAYILVFGLLVLLIVPRVNAAWGIVVGFVAVAAAFGTAWILFTQARWVIDGLYPGVAVALVFVTTALTAYLRSEQQREQVRGAFGRYLAPALVERLADNPEQLVLGGEIRDMTILFSDIRGFTSISEQYDAGGLTRFMNAYLTPMTSTILDRGGTVDKYMGDAIMAFWNAPIDDADHAENACRAALEMTERLRGLNETWRKEAEADGRLHLPVEIGIGLNSGPCCVGNMGSEQRFDYSVLGDDVNLASRLEGQCKYYGTAIIIGESTHAKIDAFATLELDLIRVKGKTEPRRIHALLGDDSLLARPAFKVLAESHAKMLDDYRNRRWTAAADSLAECRKYATDSLHALYELYAARIRAFQRTPPPADWDGVYVAEEK
jgi:adenylate cyclase